MSFFGTNPLFPRKSGKGTAAAKEEAAPSAVNVADLKTLVDEYKQLCDLEMKKLEITRTETALDKALKERLITTENVAKLKPIFCRFMTMRYKLRQLDYQLNARHRQNVAIRNAMKKRKRQRAILRG